MARKLPPFFRYTYILRDIYGYNVRTGRLERLPNIQGVYFEPHKISPQIFSQVQGKVAGEFEKRTEGYINVSVKVGEEVAQVSHVETRGVGLWRAAVLVDDKRYAAGDGRSRLHAIVWRVLRALAGA